MSRSTPAAVASRAMICTISSRTSPRPPGNWCEARSVIGAANTLALYTANKAPLTSACWIDLMSLLLLWDFAAYPKLYHPGSAQPGDLRIVLAEQPAQDLVGVLAKLRGCLQVLDRCLRKSHGARHERQLTRGKMLELDAHAARLHLGFFEDLSDVVDRSVRYAGRFEQLEPVALAAFLEHLCE